MAIVLLDTSVASLYLPHRRIAAQRSFYDELLEGEKLALSFQSVAELWKLAVKNRWASKSYRDSGILLRASL
jgi:hypothetical protein